VLADWALEFDRFVGRALVRTSLDVPFLLKTVAFLGDQERQRRIDEELVLGALPTNLRFVAESSRRFGEALEALMLLRTEPAAELVEQAIAINPNPLFHLTRGLIGTVADSEDLEMLAHHYGAAAADLQTLPNVGLAALGGLLNARVRIWKRDGTPEAAAALLETIGDLTRRDELSPRVLQLVSTYADDAGAVDLGRTLIVRWERADPDSLDPLRRRARARRCNALGAAGRSGLVRPAAAADHGREGRGALSAGPARDRRAARAVARGARGRTGRAGGPATGGPAGARGRERGRGGVMDAGAGFRRCAGGAESAEEKGRRTHPERPPRESPTMDTPDDGSPIAKAAIDRLVPLLEAELRRLAAAHLARERPSHTLQPTALVNEAYVRLLSQRSLDVEDRAGFVAVAATVFRRILVDHARTKGARKRGGDREQVTLSGVEPSAKARSIDVLALHEALERLEAIDPRRSRVVELRYFGGLGSEEIGRVMGLTRRQVDGAWAATKRWLARELHRGG